MLLFLTALRSGVTVADSEDQVFFAQRELLDHLQGNKFVAEIHNQWPVEAISQEVSVKWL